MPRKTTVTRSTRGEWARSTCCDPRSPRRQPPPSAPFARSRTSMRFRSPVTLSATATSSNCTRACPSTRLRSSVAPEDNRHTVPVGDRQTGRAVAILVSPEDDRHTWSLTGPSPSRCCDPRSPRRANATSSRARASSRRSGIAILGSPPRGRPPLGFHDAVDGAGLGAMTLGRPGGRPPQWQAEFRAACP